MPTPNATLARRAREQYNAHVAEATKIIERAGGRPLTASEDSRVENLERLAGVAEQRAARYERAAADSAATLGNAREQLRSAARVTRDALVYKPGGQASYFKDLILRERDLAAAARLARHHRQMSDVAEERARDAGRAFDAALQTHGGTAETRIAANNTQGQGGYLAPPAYLIDRTSLAPAAGRPIGNLANKIPLPVGVQSVSIPYLTANPIVSVQPVDNAAVGSRDITDSQVTAPVVTLTGKIDIAMQVVEQTPIAFDELMLEAVQAEYNSRLEAQIVNGTGTGGQLQGLLGATGGTAVTYTDATPTAGELVSPIMACVAAVSRARKQLPTAIIMRPSRWNWLCGSSDQDGQPIAEPGRGFMSTVDDLNVGDQTPIGPLGGWPVFLDERIPETLGASGTEDRIIVARCSDLLLFESEQMQSRIEFYTDVQSGTLTARFLFWAYAALAIVRPESVGVVSGTGLVSTGF